MAKTKARAPKAVKKSSPKRPKPTSTKPKSARSRNSKPATATKSEAAAPRAKVAARPATRVSGKTTAASGVANRNQTAKAGVVTVAAPAQTPEEALANLGSITNQSGVDLTEKIKELVRLAQEQGYLT